MTTLTCDHGYFLADCALCEKREGECDYGSCTDDATARTVYIRGGKVLNVRPVCEGHIPAMTCAGAVPDDLRTEVRR